MCTEEGSPAAAHSEEVGEGARTAVRSTGCTTASAGSSTPMAMAGVIREVRSTVGQTAGGSPEVPIGPEIDTASSGDETIWPGARACSAKAATGSMNRTVFVVVGCCGAGRRAQSTSRVQVGDGRGSATAPAVVSAASKVTECCTALSDHAPPCSTRERSNASLRAAGSHGTQMATGILPRFAANSSAVQKRRQASNG